MKLRDAATAKPMVEGSAGPGEKAGCLGSRWKYEAQILELIMGVAERVTRMLANVEVGGASAAEQLLPVVYDELRRLAAAKLAQQPPGQTLQPTALVHEAYLRLVGNTHRNYADHRHFFAAAAEAMRHILVDNARRKKRAKHGAGQQRVALDAIDIAAAAEEEKLVLVNEALDKLALEDPVRAEVVKLRYFVGLTHAESAQVLGLSEKTVRRHWEFARVWLYDAIRSQQ